MQLAITSHSKIWQQVVVPFRPKRQEASGVADRATFAVETLCPELDVRAVRSAAGSRARQAVNGSKSLAVVRCATNAGYARPAV
ncbi:hypothetical protein NXC24_PB00121 (plasmid) [Rhizobium sp. NXC24]|nr:hypothetical protein NXC24_PB00121 [Rhizobium sp. NXC24]